MSDGKKFSLAPILFLLGLNIAVFAVGGLGLIFLRQQISLTSGNVRDLERKIGDVDTRLRDRDSYVAHLESPAYLRAEIQRNNLTLGLPEQHQVIRVRPENRRESPRSRPSMADQGDAFLASLDNVLLRSLEPEEDTAE